MTDSGKSPARSRKSASKLEGTFSAEELAAMQETKAERRKGKANGEADVLAKIAEMEGLDRTLAEAIHALVKANAPTLAAKTWYGMPAYANADGKIVCFFQSAGKFKARYATLGFNDAARLDEGSMWPTSFALTGLTPADEKTIAALIVRAAEA
jgi:uncharacterized protein YdhG (YjbR/CyaY superfamily)